MAKNNPHGLREMILVLKSVDRAHLGKIRCIPHIKAAEADHLIWLRGISTEVDLPLVILQLPVYQSYYLDEDQKLFEKKAYTPIAQLPDLNWRPIDAFFPVEMPVAAFAGRSTKDYRVKMVPSKIEQDTIALMTNLNQWKRYVDTASIFRMERLKYAVSEEQQVLVVGNPLPPLPGKSFWMKDQLLLPAGWDFEIPSSSFLVSQKINEDKDAYCIFDEYGNWERIPMKDLKNVSRSGVRKVE